jgi:hypothetical protein
MKKLLTLAVASLFATVAYGAFAADPVKVGPTDKPGRAIDDGAVKSGPVEKPGRAADDSSAVKAGGSATKPGRAADEEKKPMKKKGKKKKEPQS